MKKIKLCRALIVGIAAIIAITYSCGPKEGYIPGSAKSGSFIDFRDGTNYNTIRIGNQWWMAENLRFDPGNGSWVYDNDQMNEKTFGRLYDWETACDVCPDGWHLPGDAEWEELIKYLGGESIAGGKLKQSGKTYWYRPNEGATNLSGFSALPGGYRDAYSMFNKKGFVSGFWSLTENNFNQALLWQVQYDNRSTEVFDIDKEYGFSVRCIMN